MNDTNTNNGMTNNGAAKNSTKTEPTAEQLAQAAIIKGELQTLENQQNEITANLAVFKANLLQKNTEIEQKRTEYRTVMGKEKRIFSDVTKAKMAESARRRWASRVTETVAVTV